MGRLAKGSVTTKTTKRGGLTFSIRFQAYGRRRSITLGTSAEGWNRQAAEAELANVLADVRRGTWRPHTPTAHDEPPEVPSFHVFASEWLANREPELRPKTVTSYRWQLVHHLLPHFASSSLSEITPERVDAYKAAKLREGRLGPNQINKTLTLLAQIYDSALDYGIVTERNPARGRRRRVRGTEPARPSLEPHQLPILLEEAGRLRLILSVLAGCGLRDGEACSLNWRDVDLANGQLIIRRSKTTAGLRRVDLPMAVWDDLAARKAEVNPEDLAGPAFVNRDGRRESVSNLGRRLKTVLRRADERLSAKGLEPIGSAVTPYSFRRLYASLRYALGDDPVYVAGQMGHADAGALSMNTYASAVRRRARLTGVALEQFDLATQWARMDRPAADAEERTSNKAAVPDLASAAR